MRINYTNYLTRKQEETDAQKIAEMKSAVVAGLKRNGIHGHISVKYYADGIALVNVDGEYYNCINTRTGEWFSGYVGN